MNIIAKKPGREIYLVVVEGKGDAAVAQVFDVENGTVSDKERVHSFFKFDPTGWEEYHAKPGELQRLMRKIENAVPRQAEPTKKGNRPVIVTWKGGPGSGHRGHRGRPGEVGGSEPGEGGYVHRTPEEQARLDYYREWDRRKALERKFQRNKRTVMPKSHDPGAFISYVAEVKNDGKAIVKPNEQYEYVAKEVATYEITKILGWWDTVPLTTETVSDVSMSSAGWRSMSAEAGTTAASIQQWIEPAIVGAEVRQKSYEELGMDTIGLLEREGLEVSIGRMMMLDIITGNTDRHHWNWLYNTETKKVVGIDHGLVFPTYMVGVSEAVTTAHDISTMFGVRIGIRRSDINKLLSFKKSRRTKKLIEKLGKHWGWGGETAELRRHIMTRIDTFMSDYINVGVHDTIFNIIEDED